MKTELVFVLDRSGSMSGLERDTIGGFNSLLEKQKKEPGKALVTTVLFDDRYEVLHDRADLEQLAPITGADYYVRGCTALLDAIGLTIQRISQAQERDAPAERPEKTLFVITTDGMENASREYDHARVRRMVERAVGEKGWEFLFLGANIDAISVAGRVGISADRAVTCSADPDGTRMNYDAVCAAASSVRASRPLAKDWKAEIERYVRERRQR